MMLPDVLAPDYQDDLRTLWQELRQQRPHLCRTSGAELLSVSDYALLHADERCRAIPLKGPVTDLYRDLAKLGPVRCRLHGPSLCHDSDGRLHLQRAALPRVELAQGGSVVRAHQVEGWFGAAVQERGWKGYHHSFQFFDPQGRLCHSIIQMPETDRAAWRALQQRYTGAAPVLAAPQAAPAVIPRWVDCEQLRAHWLTQGADHQGRLTAFPGLPQQEVVSRLGSDLAQRLPLNGLPAIAARLGHLGLSFQAVACCGQVQHRHLARPTKVSLLSCWLNLHGPGWSLHVKMQPGGQLWLVRPGLGEPWELRLYDGAGDPLLMLAAHREDAGQQWAFQCFLQQLARQESA